MTTAHSTSESEKDQEQIMTPEISQCLTVQAFGGPVPVRSFAKTLMTIDPEKRTGLFRSLQQKSEEADRIFQTHDFITEIAQGALGLTGYPVAISEPIIHQIILCLSEASTNFWMEEIWKTDLDKMNAVKLVEMIGKAYLNDASQSKQEITKLTHHEPQAALRTFPKGYSEVLKNFISDQHGLESVLAFHISHLQQQLRNTTEPHLQKNIAGNLCFLALRLHAATHPDDFYFDTLPAALLIPRLSGDPIEGAIVLEFLRRRVDFELDMLDDIFGQKDPETPEDIRLKNLLALSCDMKVAAWSALSENNSTHYTEVMTYYLEGLSHTHQTTWSEFRSYFQNFYQRFADTHTFSITKRLFVEHPDIKEDSSLLTGGNTPDRRALATQKAKENLRSLQNSIADLNQQAQETYCEDTVHYATLLTQAFTLLTAAREAVQNHDMKRYEQLWAYYNVLRNRIKTTVSTRADQLDKEQDDLMAELTHKSGVSKERKAEILARATAIQNELQTLETNDHRGLE